MVARILIINENKPNDRKILSKLKDSYYSLIFSKSIEDSLKIIKTQEIDIVFLFLPQNFCEKSSELFFDFFSILMQLCGVIPIIGITESKEQVIPPARFDDIIFADVEKSDLIRRLKTFLILKNKFDNTLLRNMHIEEHGVRKIALIFHKNVNFLHKSIYKNTKIVKLNAWPIIDHICDSDLFIIDINHRQAYKCCANLRLLTANKSKLIAFTYNKHSKEKMRRASELDVGAIDFIDTDVDPFFIKFRVNSLLRYRKTYESFLEKLKKSIYLSTIDSATEVYNRSFFDDYLKNKLHCMSHSAIVMLDVDKFKIINDKYGHSFADSMLKYISSIIKRHVRSSDIVARYGGDEFIILMNDVSKVDVVDIVHRIQKKIEDSLFCNAYCTVSIGVCCIEPGGDISFPKAISIADDFMYAAKKDGGNTVRVV
ncbi:MAG: diguanylate cyclase [Holosporaceae bacterium]|jgi:two-component system cell cycle response regulator|nr:diguanylate cyclase [Holosporaceae bacterium]